MRIPEFLRLRLRAWAHKKTQTKPDFIIRPRGTDQTLRWWVIPRNRFFNIYLHKFIQSDEDMALHDHPWHNASILIDGEYIEHREGIWPKLREEGYVYFRKASSAHRVELFSATKKFYHYVGINQHPVEETINDQGKYKSVITIFITGPKIREWGFWCPKGWRHWKDFCDSRDHGVIGKGCE